jgi:site-specific DNA recombinase
MKRAVILLRVSSEGQTKRAGAEEGYSIEVQREGCHGKARQYEADVVREFVGPAQSASKGIYPALRDALDFVRDQREIDYLIVYRLDRFARDELTQFAALAELRAAGTELVSVMEPIDNTPQGLLSLGILASVNAFRSRDDGHKIREGLVKKARSGGTPGRVRLGYLNRQRWEGKNDIRDVVIDPERGPHMRWAFEQYATGEWSIGLLNEALYDRGVRTRPNKRYPARKLSPSALHEILRDPYYIGVVRYKGVEYGGVHEPLIDQDTFSRVQAILDAKGRAGEKQRRHPHFLKGTIYCGHCERRFAFTRSRGNGGSYDYFMCAGRHSDRSGCPQPYVSTALVEDKVARLYARQVRVPAERVARLRDDLIAGFAGVTKQRTATVNQARRRLDRAEAERRKLIQLSYAGKIPDDLFGEEQDRLKREITDATQVVEQAGAKLDQLTVALDDALALALDAEQHYQAASPTLRRQLNQVFFARIYVRDTDISGGVLAEPYAGLLDPDLPATLERRGPRSAAECGHGSRERVSVELAGLEPATFALPARRSPN